MESPHHSDTILIVDDSPEHRELFSMLLHQAGFGILVAGDAGAGYELAQSRRPDMVISDVVMPNVSGIDLCRLIRSDRNLRGVPILLISALDKQTESVVEALRIGADDYIEMPFEPHRLVAKVARLLERKRGEDLLEMLVIERTAQLTVTNKRLQ
jgi:DNA-binding response OmpR family regulator